MNSLQHKYRCWMSKWKKIQFTFIVIINYVDHERLVISQNKLDIYVFVTITGSADGLLVPESIARPVVGLGNLHGLLDIRYICLKSTDPT
jgi:hypothetical protein